MILLARSGLRGLVRLPHEPEDCLRLYRQYDDFLRRREAEARELIADRTLDEELQEKIYGALIPLFLRGS